MFIQLLIVSPRLSDCGLGMLKHWAVGIMSWSGNQFFCDLFDSLFTAVQRVAALHLRTKQYNVTEAQACVLSHSIMELSSHPSHCIWLCPTGKTTVKSTYKLWAKFSNEKHPKKKNEHFTVKHILPECFEQKFCCAIPVMEGTVFHKVHN